MGPRTRALAVLCVLSPACTGEPPDGHRNDGTTDTSGACSSWEWGEARSVTLSTDAPAGAFAEVEHDTSDCDQDQPLTALLEVTGDDFPDLLELEDCTDATVGVDHWRVWPGGADGFGAALEWTLPGGYETSAFTAASRLVADCTVGEPAWFLEEVTGDGVPDLVVTTSCTDDTVGDTAWLVYPGGSAGFGAEERWALPSGAATGSWQTPNFEMDCTAGDRPAWSLTDLDGDGTFDLVVTASCLDGETGRNRWNLFRGGQGGFATSTPWAIPPELRADVAGRGSANCDQGEPAFFLSQLDGAQGPDIVVPAGCSSLGSDWVVYPGSTGGFGEALPYRAPFGTGALLTAPFREEPNCAAGVAAWRFDDLDGDQRSDLLYVSSCEDAAVGEGWWLVAFGGDEGLGELQPIALPSGYSAGGFDVTHADERSCNGAANRPAWFLSDLDGVDGVELVLTSACDDPELGVERWESRSLTCSG